MNAKKAAEVLKKAELKIEDLVPFADFTHPPKDGYGRKMVVLDDRFEIMVMSWNPGDFSAIHDHGYTQWGAVQVFGNVMHNIYTNAGGVFKLSKQEILPKGSIAKVNNALIHQMGNVTSEPYLTLHLYGSDDTEGIITADAKIYELECNLIKHTTGGAFFNLPDSEVYDSQPIGPIDRKTFIYHASLLLRYYERFDDDEIGLKRDYLLNKIQQLQTA